MITYLNADLHCHSRVSDGALSPNDVVMRATANGVDLLALTDHDEIAGLVEAAEAARTRGLRFIPGVEISVTWGGTQIHIVGLNVDATHSSLVKILEYVRSSRRRRAERIAEELAKVGIDDALRGAYTYAAKPYLIGRPEFARYLVERGYGSDVADVMKHYLGSGKPGHVPHEYATLSHAVQSIKDCGGRAVIAHPGRYKLASAELRRLFKEFKQAGGEAIEVVTGSHTPDQYAEFARLACEFEFTASRGSDFHGPEESCIDLGRMPSLPDDHKPVWHDW